MKVIEEGNYGNVFPMIVKCEMIKDEYGFTYGKSKDFCGSKIEIEVEDIKKHKWDKYPDYCGTDYGFVCPVCKKFVVVDKNKISQKILDEAEEIYLSRV
jgi:hypothetical protein